MQLPEDSEFINIAKEGLNAEIPIPWVAYFTENNEIFYYNKETGEKMWEHPMDNYYKSLFLTKKKDKMQLNKKKNDIDVEFQKKKKAIDDTFYKKFDELKNNVENTKTNQFRNKLEEEKLHILNDNSKKAKEIFNYIEQKKNNQLEILNSDIKKIENNNYFSPEKQIELFLKEKEKEFNLKKEDLKEVINYKKKKIFLLNIKKNN